MEPLRSALRLLVVLGLVLSTQSLLLLQTAFELRRDYIVEHLCVNRDRPEEECNGKCYLRMRSEGHLHGEHVHGEHAQEGPHSHPPSERQATLLEVALSVTLLVPERPVLRLPPEARAAYPAWRSALHDEAFTSEVFHPPRAA